MKKINNKIKILSAILIGIIIGSSIAVYAASYFAKDVSYKKGDTEISVEQALNELYNKQNEDEYAGKPYTQEGLSIYDNRIEIIEGGYYTDSQGSTWVNVTFKANKSFYKDGAWLFIEEGLPSISGNFIVSDTKRKHAFRIGNYNAATNGINFADMAGEDIKINEIITLKFKY